MTEDLHELGLEQGHHGTISTSDAGKAEAQVADHARRQRRPSVQRAPDKIVHHEAAS